MHIEKLLIVDTIIHIIKVKIKALYLDEEFDDVEDKATYKSMLTRDERRFKTADQDGDGIATREEFTAFLHPEEFDYMKDVVVQVESTHYKLHINVF